MFNFFRRPKKNEAKPDNKIDFETLTPDRLIMMEKFTPAQLLETYYPYRLPFEIKSNTTPPRERFDILNFYEMTFFSALIAKLVKAKLNPKNITITRLGDNTFNVDYNDSLSGCYVGKINLMPESAPDKYAVLRDGAKRALRVFENKYEAEKYLKEHNGDAIEYRQGFIAPFFMQYLRGLNGIHRVQTKDIQECINHIDDWVKYIKYCLKDSY